MQGPPVLHSSGAGYVYRGVVMMEHDLDLLAPLKGNCNATACRVILHNCVLPPLWKQFEEAPCIGVMVRRPETFAYVVYFHCHASVGFYSDVYCLFSHMYASDTQLYLSVD